MSKKYDVGIIGLWYGRNYGSMVTYYALHSVITDMGYSVLMINNPWEMLILKLPKHIHSVLLICTIMLVRD